MQFPDALEIERASPKPSEGIPYSSLRLPLVRLLQLLMILQGGRYPNARGLAEACAVSRRTIYRDLPTTIPANAGPLPVRVGAETTSPSVI